MDRRPTRADRRIRGATRQPPNRFESAARVAEDDGWGGLEALAEEPPPATTLSHEAARSALSFNESPDVPFDRALNPYRGCEHGCVYCFARPTHNALGYSSGLDFETRLVVRDGLAERLRAELAKPGYRPAPVYLSGVTDAYQPVERRERATRAVLELLAETRHPVGIVTKSALVARDLDLLAPMAAEGLAHVCLSVTTLDADLARRMEPRAASPAQRIATVRRLSEAGVPTTLLMSPMIAGLNDHEIEAVLEAGAGAGARAAGFIMLRLPHDLGTLWEDWLETHAPGRKARILARQRELRGGRLNDPRFGARMRGSGPHYEMIRARFRAARRRLGLADARPTLRTDLFRPPARDSRQLALF